MSAIQTGYVGLIPLAVLRSVVVRVGIVMVCLACMALVFWSLYFRLQPVNQEHQKRALELSHLMDLVERLRLTLKSGTVDQAAMLDSSTSALIFCSRTQLREWQQQVRHQASLVNLEAKIRFGAGQAYPGLEQKLVWAQAHIDLDPTSKLGDTNSPYQHLLQFNQFLLTSEKHCNLIGLTVYGNSNSIQHVNAVVQLLATANALR